MKRRASRFARRRMPAFSWRRHGPPAAVAVLILAVGAGGWWTWRDGWVERLAQRTYWRLIAVTADLGFSVQEILVVGRNQSSREHLMDAIRLARGAPLAAFDPEAARRRILALPWVREATVQRMLPDTVFVQIEERRPLALWQHQGRFRLVDEDGEVIDVSDLDRFTDLLVIVGEDAPPHALALLETLKTQESLRARVKAAVRVGGRRWNLRLDNDIDVRLPEEDTAGAWARLAEYERIHNILARDVSSLDLRLPDRLIVRGRHGQERTPGDGQDT